MQQEANDRLTTRESDKRLIYKTQFTLDGQVDQIAFDKDVIHHAMEAIGSTVRTTRDRLFTFGISVMGFADAGSAMISMR